MVLRNTSYSELHRLLDRMEQRVMGLQDCSLWPRPIWDSPPAMEILTYGPTFHVTENSQRYSIEAAMPGFDRDDLEVSVKEGTVQILGRKKDDQREGRGPSFWLRRQEAFSHTVRLPWYVNAKGASAKFKDGVLTISLPKGEISATQIIPIHGKSSMVAERFAELTDTIKRGFNFLLRKLGVR